MDRGGERRRRINRGGAAMENVGTTFPPSSIFMQPMQERTYLSKRMQPMLACRHHITYLHMYTNNYSQSFPVLLISSFSTICPPSLSPPSFSLIILLAFVYFTMCRVNSFASASESRPFIHFWTDDLSSNGVSFHNTYLIS